jgi:hypothetical protein
MDVCRVTGCRFGPVSRLALILYLTRILKLYLSDFLGAREPIEMQLGPL